MKSIPISLLLTGAISLSAFADVGFISSNKAKVYSVPSFKSKVVMEASKGQEVFINEVKGTWVSIRYGDKQGWVSKYIIKSSPPSKKIRVIGSEDQIELIDVRRRSSAVSTAAAARGLASSIRVQDSEKNKADIKAVAYMESFTISDTDLKQFAQRIGAEHE